MNVGGYAGSKVGATGGVKRNGQHAAQHAAVEGGDPLGTIFSPKHDAVALDDTVVGQESGESAGEARQIAVGADVTPIAAKMHHGGLAVEAAKVVDQCGEIVAHDSFPARTWYAMAAPTLAFR